MYINAGQRIFKAPVLQRLNSKKAHILIFSIIFQLVLIQVGTSFATIVYTISIIFRVAAVVSREDTRGVFI